MSLSSLEQLLATLREQSQTTHYQGKLFEDLIVQYLRHDKAQSLRYQTVWSYVDWAREHDADAQDTGIDIIAQVREEHGGGLCAVQCKFHLPGATVSKSDIDSFLAESSRAQFSDRLIVDTTKKPWSTNAQKAIEGLTPPCRRIDIYELAQSSIDWSLYKVGQVTQDRPAKKTRPHQTKAIADVFYGLKEHDRGKLIMACGTGKTYTSLRVAERIAGRGKRVLYLVPSLALMSQTLREWVHDSDVPIHALAACSDSRMGDTSEKDDPYILTLSELFYPATTQPRLVAKNAMHAKAQDKMTVVFSTYQSIEVIHKAQHSHELGDFDLIICDEAHRTTGQLTRDEDSSYFVKVHDPKYIRGTKRLYMTATPQIYRESAKQMAQKKDVVLCSMDDESLYGPEFYRLNFGDAVRQKLLTDYKVIVLGVDEQDVSDSAVDILQKKAGRLTLEDTTKIVGCYHALSKFRLGSELVADDKPMQRAVAFCQTIKLSQTFCDELPGVINAYLKKTENEIKDHPRIACEAKHVDGTFKANARAELLDWLRDDGGEGVCRILSNARCLTEGVDVPALDAVLFMHPRKSEIDAVQAVGRVMRKFEGKTLGYIILPIPVSMDKDPEVELNNNNKFRQVWQILNALRSHDRRLDISINLLPYSKDGSGRNGGGNGNGGQVAIISPNPQIDLFAKAVRARIVKKCGNRGYESDWANDIAKIARTHITHIKTAIKDKNSKASRAFYDFLGELHHNINDSISETDAIDMLAQHMVTKPVFDALFGSSVAAQQNPVSKALQNVCATFDKAQSMKQETDSLQGFYQDVQERAQGIKSAEGQQKFIIRLYEDFFSTGFKRTSERLGIAYTPVEVVDFIIHSVNDLLQQEFQQSLASPNVHILDPFVGTGTFITRLMQNGVLNPKQLQAKYQRRKHNGSDHAVTEIHANEMLLLPYYIATTNIENAYQQITKQETYQPFEGICLADTFTENPPLLQGTLKENNERLANQRSLKSIQVIIGNPPYSAGQKSANQNNPNTEYDELDKDIRQNYGQTKTTNINSLYDSYIRGIRWASNRIGKQGIIGFVTNAGWLDGRAMDGMRACLAREFSSIYIFHLRGNARTSGEQRRKEKDNVFGQSTRTPVAIALLVKNPHAKEKGQIFFHDIGDYLSRDEKLSILKKHESVKNINWRPIEPNKHHDWLNQRKHTFERYISIGDKKNLQALSLFDNYSAGLKTNRDPWCYNMSKGGLAKNIRRTMEFYNYEVERYKLSGRSSTSVNTFVDNDPTKVKWSSGLLAYMERGHKAEYQFERFKPSLYRPFTKQWLYYDRMLNERVYQMPKIFPMTGESNRVICVTGIGAVSGFSVLMTDTLPDLSVVESSQCFPLKLYHQVDSSQQGGDLYRNLGDGVVVYDVMSAISDDGLLHFYSAYKDHEVREDDIFYYTYGVLHSPEYRQRYANNLLKELPRIPCVPDFETFQAYVEAGRALGELHVNYEKAEPYDVKLDYSEGTMFQPEAKDYYVKSMKFSSHPTSREKDKSTIIYNEKITLRGVPLRAYDYVVGGKPAIEWVMERQGVKTDKDSGIVNDANDYANETVKDAAYPLKLLQRVITVSLKTLDIIDTLPSLKKTFDP